MMSGQSLTTRIGSRSRDNLRCDRLRKRWLGRPRNARTQCQGDVGVERVVGPKLTVGADVAASATSGTIHVHPHRCRKPSDVLQYVEGAYVCRHLKQGIANKENTCT